MKLFTEIYKRTRYTVGRMFRETGLAMDNWGSRHQYDLAYLEPLSRHRNIMPLYDCKPEIYNNSFIAPNATVAGQVLLGSQSSIWYGASLRAEWNAIRYTYLNFKKSFLRIGDYTSIGDNSVIWVTDNLPTGVPSSCNIGNNVTIQHGCNLFSCQIDDRVVVGFKSVVSEGAQLERGCMIAPNSVVPPGRVIPSNQLWAGSPVEYVRDLSENEIEENYSKSLEIVQKSQTHKSADVQYLS